MNRKHLKGVQRPFQLLRIAAVFAELVCGSGPGEYGGHLTPPGTVYIERAISVGARPYLVVPMFISHDLDDREAAEKVVPVRRTTGTNTKRNHRHLGLCD